MNKDGQFHLDGTPPAPRGGTALQAAMLPGEGSLQVQDLSLLDVTSGSTGLETGSSLAQGFLLLDVSPPFMGLATAGVAMTKLSECNTTIIGPGTPEYGSGCCGPGLPEYGAGCCRPGVPEYGSGCCGPGMLEYGSR